MVDWDSLIFGKYDIKTIQKAVDNISWQNFRQSLAGLPLEEKYRLLKKWIRDHPGERAKIQVTNYVNALKRAGLVK